MSNWFVEPMKDEVPYSDILKKAENGEFHEWNFQPLDFQENGYEDVIDEIKKYTAVDYLHLKELKEKAEKDGDKQAAQEYADKMEEMVQAVMKIYRTKNIFPIQYFSEFGILDEIAKCIAYKAEFDGDTVSCVTGDTEFYNGYKWKRIDEYTEGDKVLQYNPDGTATLVNPLRYIHYQSDDSFYRYGLYTPYITENHNIVKIVDENGKLCLMPLSDLFTKADYVKVPVSAVYKGGSPVSRLVLVDTYAAVIWQDKKFMTVYNTVDSDGYITLSERCFSLSLGCRLRLLELFGISGEVIESAISYGFDDTQIYWSYGNTMRRSLLMIISNLVSISYSNVSLLRDFESEDELGIISSACFSTFGDLSYRKEDWEELKGVKDKYCFSVPSHMLVLRYNGIVNITGNCGAGIGTSLCNYLFPNLYDTPSAHDLDKENARSLFEKFHNDKYLRRAIEFCFGYKNGCPVPTSVTGGLRLVGSAPTNFRPMNAKAVYERFCPKGGVIYDYCCGFGGRLLGALSSKNNYKYVGTDPCTETMYHLHQLGQYIEQVTGREDSYELHCCGSEEFRGPKNSIDFAFSSPPYFNLEVYSDEPTQCFNKFPELEGWLEGFVRPTIQNIKHMLKPGKLYAVNIADFKVGSGKEVAYVDEWIRISTEEGMPLFDTVYLGVTARAGSAEQAAGELKKENILIFKKPLW